MLIIQIVTHTTRSSGCSEFHSRHCCGAAPFKALMTWAAQNLTAEQMQGLKRVLESGDMEKIKEVLLGLQKAFNESKVMRTIGFRPSEDQGFI